MSPEQALGKGAEMDGRADLWSLGATMFSLLSGKLVHEGDSAEQVFVSAATRPARSLAAVLPEASCEIVGIVDRALAFEKDARWPSATAMRDAVRAHVTSGGPTLLRSLIDARAPDESAAPSMTDQPWDAPPAHGAVARDAPTRTMPTPEGVTRTSALRASIAPRAPGRRRVAVMLILTVAAASGLWATWRATTRSATFASQSSTSPAASAPIDAALPEPVEASDVSAEADRSGSPRASPPASVASGSVNRPARPTAPPPRARATPSASAPSAPFDPFLTR
jgi:serine/threonine-protein kinase